MYIDIIIADNPNPDGRFYTKANALWDRQDLSQPVMIDDAFERQTNQIILDNARGDVLIFGLGIGLIVYPIMKKDTVKSILIVEKHQEVLDLIMPQTAFNDKVKVIKGDWYDYETEKTYDTIWLDDWTSPLEDEELRKLNGKMEKEEDSRQKFIERYTPWLNDDGFIDFWHLPMNWPDEVQKNA